MSMCRVISVACTFLKPGKDGVTNRHYHFIGQELNCLVNTRVKGLDLDPLPFKCHALFLCSSQFSSASPAGPSFGLYLPYLASCALRAVPSVCRAPGRCWRTLKLQFYDSHLVNEWIHGY